MKPIKALCLLFPIALAIGNVPEASAQQQRTSFRAMGCALGTDELVRLGLIEEGVFEPGTAIVSVDPINNTKNCPGSEAQPAIQLNCRFLLDPDPGLNLETRRITCLINGQQCGFAQTFAGDNNRLTITAQGAVNDDGEPIGVAELRCSRRVQPRGGGAG